VAADLACEDDVVLAAEALARAEASKRLGYVRRKRTERTLPDWYFSKPASGLEPETPSLQMKCSAN
jgi:hypothetical protein